MVAGTRERWVLKIGGRAVCAGVASLGGVVRFGVPGERGKMGKDEWGLTLRLQIRRTSLECTVDVDR